MNEISPHVKLALATIEAYVKQRRVIDVPNDTPEELLTICAGTFVCLKKHGELRGCIGTIEPVCESLAKEIVTNAISAAANGVDEVAQIYIGNPSNSAPI